MPDIYKGMTVPRYDETADGPAAFKALVDSGPIPRVDAEQLGEIADAGPQVGCIVYFTPLNVLLQWCGPTLTWKRLWAYPWGRVEHWNAATSSAHTNVESTVTGFGNLAWTAYPGRYYRVTVTGRIGWVDEGTSQGTPGWTVDGKVARAVIQLKQVSDNSQVLRVYDGRGGFMYLDDVEMFSTTWIVGNLDGGQ